MRKLLLLSITVWYILCLCLSPKYALSKSILVEKQPSHVNIDQLIRDIPLPATPDKTQQDSLVFSKSSVPGTYSHYFSSYSGAGVNSLPTQGVDPNSEEFQDRSRAAFSSLGGDEVLNFGSWATKTSIPRLPTTSTPSAEYQDYNYPDPTYSVNFFNSLPSENLASLGKIKSLRNEVCQAKLFNHTISKEGCEPKVIKNRFCYGRCNSFYVPLSDVEITNRKFVTCSICKPQKVELISVKLKCEPGIKRTVQVEKVKDCRCSGQVLPTSQNFGFR